MQFELRIVVLVEGEDVDVCRVETSGSPEFERGLIFDFEVLAKTTFTSPW
jgi:hypothetical protein